MLSAQCRQLYRTAPHLRLLSSRRLLSSVPSDTGAQPTTPPHHEPESEENLALFDKLSSERWSGKIRLFTHVLVSVAIGIYAVGFMDYSPFLGDREHVFTPIQRWVKRQQKALFTLSEEEKQAAKRTTNEE